MAEKPIIKNKIKAAFAKARGFVKGVLSFVKQKVLSVSFSGKTLDEFCDYANDPTHFVSSRELSKIREDLIFLVRTNHFGEDAGDILDVYGVEPYTGGSDEEAAAEYVDNTLLDAYLAQQPSVARRTAEFLTAQTETIARLVAKKQDIEEPVEEGIRRITIQLVAVDEKGEIVGGGLAPALRRIANSLNEKMPNIPAVENTVREAVLSHTLKREGKDCKKRTAGLDKFEKMVKSYNKQIDALVEARKQHEKLITKKAELETEIAQLDIDAQKCKNYSSKHSTSVDIGKIWQSEPWVKAPVSTATQKSLQKVFGAMSDDSVESLYDKKSHKITGDLDFDTMTPFELAAQIASRDKSFTLIKNNITGAKDVASYNPDDGRSTGFLLLTKTQVKFLEAQFKAIVESDEFSVDDKKTALRNGFSKMGVATQIRFYQHMLAKAKAVTWSDAEKVAEAEKDFKGISQFYADDLTVNEVMQQKFREDLSKAVTLRVAQRIKSVIAGQKEKNESDKAVITLDIATAKDKFEEAKAKAQELVEKLTESVDKICAFEDGEPDYYRKRTALAPEGSRTSVIEQLINALSRKNIAGCTIDSDERVLEDLHQANTDAEVAACSSTYRKMAKIITDAEQALDELKASHTLLASPRISDEDYAKGVAAIYRELSAKLTSGDPLMKEMASHIAAMESLVKAENELFQIAAKKTDSKKEEAAEPADDFGLSSDDAEELIANADDAEEEEETPEAPAAEEEAAATEETEEAPAEPAEEVVEAEVESADETAAAEPRFLDDIEKDVADCETELKDIEGKLIIRQEALKLTKDSFRKTTLKTDIANLKARKSEIKKKIKKLQAEVKAAKKASHKMAKLEEAAEPYLDKPVAHSANTTTESAKPSFDDEWD